MTEETKVCGHIDSTHTVDDQSLHCHVGAVLARLKTDESLAVFLSASYTSVCVAMMCSTFTCEACRVRTAIQSQFFIRIGQVLFELYTGATAVKEPGRGARKPCICDEG